jgi:hypothetical protein
VCVRVCVSMFGMSMHILVDQWTATVSLTDYTDMLTALHESVRLKLTALGFIQARPSRLPFIPTDESEVRTRGDFSTIFLM